MNHAERKARRRRIAAAVASGSSIHQVLEKFDVSMSLLRQACAEFRVAVPSSPKPAPKAMIVLGKLLRGEKPAQIRKELGCRRQYVFQVRDQAREAGIAV